MSGLRTFLGSTAGLFTCLIAAALGIYLLVYHLTHVALVLPYLVLLACPLMHFMHRSRHHHGVRKTDSGTPRKLGV
jgi:multisubunit Na+/H+ antiporter MnhG subunit